MADGEEKAQSYVKACYHSSLWNSAAIRRKVLRVKTALRFTLPFLLLACMSAGQQPSYCPEHSVCPKDGFIPDEKTAVLVAEAVLTPIYGADHIAHERPFKARLEAGRWVVSGSLPQPKRKDEIIVGGTATVELDKQDGRVLSVYHMK